MDWQAYAAQVEGELKAAEENNSKLKAEVRGLRKQLIEASPKPDQQLAQVREIAANNKDKDIKHLNNLKQDLDASQRARDAAFTQVTKLEAAQRETSSELAATHSTLEAKHAETQKLNAVLAEQHNLLQQARQQQAAAAQKPRPGAVSYQQRVSVLERQLRVQQAENAKLLGLSNDKPGKPQEDEDDSEPEEPSGPLPTEKKALHHPSPLVTNSRPAKDYSSPPSGIVRKPAPAPKPKILKKRAPMPKNAATTNGPSGKSVNIDLTTRDNEQQPASKLSVKSAAPRQLPIRTSIHDNITVADQTPQRPSVPSRSSASSARPPARSSSAAASPPLGKRKRSTQGAASIPKHKRSRAEEMKSELSDLAIDAHGFHGPITPRSRRRVSYQEDEEDDSDDDSFESSMDFTFTAVCSYDATGGVADHYPCEELNGCVSALWERIHQVENAWEDACGEDWQWEFKKARKTGPPVCVTQKVLKKGTNWGGQGVEAGKYACVDCVGAGKPCFTFVRDGQTGRKGDFRLLPLRAEARTKPVAKDQETRYWINDGKVSGSAE